MIGAIIGTIATTLMGSLLWKLALILGAVLLIGWLARRIVRGKRDGAPASNEVMALIMMVAIAGAVAGIGYGAADRAAESVEYTKERAKIEAQLLEATVTAENAKTQLAAERKLAASEARRAEAAEKKVIASQRARSDELNDLRRRVRDVSKNADGDICSVPGDWVSAYNAAIGFGDLPAVTGDTGRSGSTANSAQATGAEGGEAGPQLGQTGLPGRSATIEDVLETHIDNAEAARDAAERLEALQAWYEDLRAERNALRRDNETDDDEDEEDFDE